MRSKNQKNGWILVENQLGYRGYIEVWLKDDKRIVIEPDEETECCWQAWLENDKTGYYDLIAYGDDFDQADREVKEWMKGH